jgi:hypothetical protein
MTVTPVCHLQGGTDDVHCAQFHRCNSKDNVCPWMYIHKERERASARARGKSLRISYCLELRGCTLCHLLRCLVCTCPLHQLSHLHQGPHRITIVLEIRLLRSIRLHFVQRGSRTAGQGDAGSLAWCSQPGFHFIEPIHGGLWGIMHPVDPYGLYHSNMRHVLDVGGAGTIGGRCRAALTTDRRSMAPTLRQ